MVIINPLLLLGKRDCDQLFHKKLADMHPVVIMCVSIIIFVIMMIMILMIQIAMTMILKDIMCEEKGWRCIWPTPTPPTHRLDFAHFFIVIIVIVIVMIIFIFIFILTNIFITNIKEPDPVHLFGDFSFAVCSFLLLWLPFQPAIEQMHS